MRDDDIVPVCLATQRPQRRGMEGGRTEVAYAESRLTRRSGGEGSDRVGGAPTGQGSGKLRGSDLSTPALVPRHDVQHPHGGIITELPSPRPEFT